MAHDREVGGIRCREVLAALSDYLDGEVDAATGRRIEAHVAGCDWCERFGGHFGAVVGELRRALATPQPLPDAVSERLRARLGLAPDSEDPSITPT